MTMTDHDNPATLVAIIIAARHAGNHELERSMRQRLDDSFGVSLSFRVKGRIPERKAELTNAGQ